MTTTPLLLRVNLNAFFAALFSGAVAGALIGGVIARLSMRVVALLLGTSGDFSVGGTLGILLIGGIFGVIFGALYPFLRLAFPLTHLWQGAAYGALWSLVVAFFFLNPEGELTLISPWVGAALFVPIPILQGMGMAWLYARAERRIASAPDRSLPLGWFAGLLVALSLAAVGMGSLAGAGVRLPPAIFDLTNRLGVDFARTGDVQRFFGILFILTWLGLCLLLFGLGSHSRRGRLTALGLLLMAAGLFHVQSPFAGTVAGIPVGRWTSASLTGAGAASLLALLLSLPRRSLHRIEIGLTSGVFVAVLLWTGSSQYRLPREMPVSESVLWGAALAVVGGAAILALIRSWDDRPARLPALCWGLAVATFLGTWAATLLNPAWNIRGIIHPFAPLGVTVYLLPWLLPVAGTLVAVRSGWWAKGG
ncbi:MAG: hypothetical protein WBO46_03860 [Caldilineaceae bacterium]